jgi:hypothetical protein
MANRKDKTNDKIDDKINNKINNKELLVEKKSKTKRIRIKKFEGEEKSYNK